MLSWLKDWAIGLTILIGWTVVLFEEERALEDIEWP